MIFVTVGTHEQQFNRLIEKIDNLKKNGIIKDEVFIQTGFSTYEPKYCKWSKLISYDEMDRYNSEADIVITHGGPASFIAPLQKGKIPIVVPRQLEFNEHVNNHQLEFSKNVSERMNNIIPVFDIEDLEDKIINYKKIVKKMNSNNASNNSKFCSELKKEINKLFN